MSTIKRFQPYIDTKIAEEGLQNGTYVFGILRVNSKSPSDAFCVIQSDCKRDILIKGKENRNRAFHGDTVIVQVHSQSEWYRKPVVEEGADDFTDEKDGNISTNKHPDMILSEIEPALGVIKTGRVVYVINCVWKNRVYACTLHPNRMEKGPGHSTEISSADSLLRAVPVDKRIPWILIQLNEVVKNILKLPGNLDSQILYPIQVQRWNDNSALPLGRLKGFAYGRAGHPDVEAKVCMSEAGLQRHEDDFNLSIYEEVERMTSEFWTELEPEAERRIDLRNKRIFTIDPSTARDLDDAIHVDVIDEEFLEVGVHIADVSHYIQEGSEIDKVAAQRCTSVYLPHRVYPMLPEGLSNSLCSLTVNEPRLTFTTWFRVRKSTGEVILDSNDPNGPRFAKTVIQSCCRLSYDDVQDVLDGIEIPLTQRPTVFESGDDHSNSNSWELLVRDFHLLREACGKIRKNRFEQGSFRVNKPKMKFNLDDNDVPISYSYERHSESHWIVEELMLLCNEVVAIKLCGTLGTEAIVRCHPDPSLEVLSERIRADFYFPEWDASSSLALCESLKLAKAKLGDEIVRVIEFWVMKTMESAMYCTYTPGYSRHYAISFDFYTHFTSPIRRYADIMVHRQLQRVLERSEIDGDNKPNEITEEGEEEKEEADLITYQCNMCNKLKREAREAQEACDVRFYCMYLRNQKAVEFTMCTVIHIFGNRLIVFVPKLTNTSPVWFKFTGKVPDWYLTDNPRLDELQEILTGPESITLTEVSSVAVKWSGESHERRISLYDRIPVAVVPLDTVPISFATFLLPPHHLAHSAALIDGEPPRNDHDVLDEDDSNN